MACQLGDGSDENVKALLGHEAAKESKRKRRCLQTGIGGAITPEPGDIRKGKRGNTIRNHH